MSRTVLAIIGHALIEIHPPDDRAILIAAPRRGTADDAHAEDHLEELGRLAHTAGANVIGRLMQRITTPSPSHLIGKGKLEELVETVKSRQATLVIFDDELTPGQGKNLEASLKVRVMDRAELILDIFAVRARSNEARMQVELAQLEYLMPRLARMWVHLSRIRGGIGLRGPGETQLETDRRMIRRKISTLKQRLEKVAKHRANLRQGRREILTVALVGYTNAGKSSLMAALTKADVFIEDRLFATLDTLTREAFIGPHHKVRLIDTVGFIRKLPHHLVASFRATLEEAAAADTILHVIDASETDWEEHLGVVDQVLADLPLSEQPVYHVFNKIDLLEDAESFCHRVDERFERSVCVSAKGRDVAELEKALQALVKAGASDRATR